MLLIQSNELIAQEKYLLIEVKYHNIETFMNISQLVTPNWNDSLQMADIECNNFDSTFFHTWESYVSDTVLVVCRKEFEKLYIKEYNKPDTTSCELGCSSFRFYDNNCHLIKDYKFYNKSDVVKFLKQLIINCEERMNTIEFKKLFLYYIEINEDY
jgi:hypothetical protein